MWFAGQSKETASVKGGSRRQQYTVDQELEFVVDGEDAGRAHEVEVEVWDMHWRNGKCVWGGQQGQGQAV